MLTAIVLLLAACGSDDSGEQPVAATSESTPVEQPAAAERSPEQTPTPADAAAPEQTPAPAEPTATSDGLYPDVLAAELSLAGDRTYSVSATLSSPYDSPERYADAWRVIGPDGTVLGLRELAHDHAGEQPFTRSLSGVEIPDGVVVVTVEGRDQLNGWGGATVEIDVPTDS